MGKLWGSERPAEAVRPGLRSQVVLQPAGFLYSKPRLTSGASATLLQ